MTILTRSLHYTHRLKLLATTTPQTTPVRTVRIAASATAQDHHASTNATPVEEIPPFRTTTPPPQAQVESHISRLPLVQSLRRDPKYKETRPHLSMNPSLRPAHFVAGSLAGPEKVTVPPYMWTAAEKLKDSGRWAGRVISVFHIGKQMCGHPGFVHGGLLSVMFDEAFARCVSASFPSGLGMTANLNVDFRKPAAPDRLYVLRADTVNVEGRKAWVEGSLSSLPPFGEESDPVMVAEARALFVEPKFAESMVPLYRD